MTDPTPAQRGDVIALFFWFNWHPAMICSHTGLNMMQVHDVVRAAVEGEYDDEYEDEPMQDHSGDGAALRLPEPEPQPQPPRTVRVAARVPPKKKPKRKPSVKATYLLNKEEVTDWSAVLDAREEEVGFCEAVTWVMERWAPPGYKGESEDIDYRKRDQRQRRREAAL